MITHYDMQTGQPEDDEHRDARDVQPLRADDELQLRLVTVQETVLFEQRISAAAPAVLMMPIDLIMGR